MNVEALDWLTPDGRHGKDHNALGVVMGFKTVPASEAARQHTGLMKLDRGCVRLVASFLSHLSYDKVVIDCGSGLYKVGYAGDDAPRNLVPPIVGRPKLSSTVQKDTYVGDEASAGGKKTFRVSLHEMWINWDDVEKVW
jgi:hypothetical protein